MADELKYQLRVVLEDEAAELARSDPSNPRIAPLVEVLERHNTLLKCQYDAFADYVAEAERQGAFEDVLYKWTKDTIANPLKKAKYLKAFTFYVDGDEVYSADKADALEADVRPLVGQGIVVSMAQT